MTRKSKALLAVVVGVFSLATTTFHPLAREGPLIPEPSETVIPTVTPRPTSTPTQTATTIPTPTPTSTQTATPTDAAIDITAGIKVRRCLFYRGLIEQWIRLEPSEFDWLTMDHVALVLAVGAVESGCDNSLTSADGHESVGIMQVIPKPWTASAELMKIPSVNIFWGMWILDRSFELAEGDPRLALAVYNCGWVDKVLEDRCGSTGGLNYADNVLDFWYPLFVNELEE